MVAEAGNARPPGPPGKVLVAGCGYVGGRLAESLAAEGIPVVGLKRDPSSLPAGVEPLAGDVLVPATLAALDALAVDALVYAVSPAARAESAYRAAYVDGLRNVLDALPPVRAVLVSSTGVYGQADGRWVDEATPPEPADASAERILEGEALVRDRGAPGIVLRLGGIYGPGRTRTVRSVLDGRAGCPGPDRYGNRIHRDDAARAARHLLSLPDPAPVYLGVDRDPAPLREVYAWVAGQAGVEDPCLAARAEGDDAAPERRGSNKRCSSRRLAESGFAFRYPTFREGYGALLEEIRAQGESG